MTSTSSILRPRSGHHESARRAAPWKAVVLLVGLAALVLAGAPSSGAAPEAASQADIASAEQHLEQARADRVAAEARLADIQAERAAITDEIVGLDATAMAVTQDLADARRAVREFAVAAYIDGGQGAMMVATLNPSEQATIAWRSEILGGQTASAADAVDRFSALKDANDPERVRAAAQLDEVNARVDAASSDALQAAAFERDAEHAVAAARAEARAAAEAERAAQAAAAENAAAAAAAAKSPDPAPVGRSAAAAPLSAAASSSSDSSTRSAPVSSPAPAPSGARGNPTAAESAALARIRQCESRGNYSIVSASGRYRGAYQFDTRTWAAVGGSGDPAAASPAEQDYRALLLYRERGRRPWPNCG